MKLNGSNLTDNIIYLFWADTAELEDIRLYNYVYNSLPDYRKAKADKYRYEGGRRESVAAFGLLTYALKTLGYSIDQMEYSTDSNGRPYFSDYPDINFSLSHSHGRVACAVSRDVIGCDVELIRDKDNSGVANRFFSENEKNYLNNIESQEQRKVEFCKIWTYKESYVKKDGRGLTIPLDSFSVINDDYEFAGKVDYNMKNDSCFYSFIDGDYVITTCFSDTGSDKKISKKYVSVSDMMR